MYFSSVPSLVLCLLPSVVLGIPFWSSPNNHQPCLTDASALDIATRWLHLWDTGAVKSLSDLTSILAPNMASYDETSSGPYSSGPSTVGLDEFLAQFNTGAPSSFTGSTQKPLVVIHGCDQLAVRWIFQGYSTGYNSTVPAGTYLEFKGNDIIYVDVEKKLIINATSSADWINLAKELGEVESCVPYC